MKFKIWDVHCHPNNPDNPSENPVLRMERILRYADRMGVERICVFMGYPWDVDPSPALLRATNDDILSILREFGSRVFGFVYLNPRYARESRDEFERCVVDGPMVGVKLWQAVKCNRPELDPIVQRAAELQALILQDTFYNNKETPPGSSTPADLAELSARHPGVPLISAHSGGNWELGLRAIRKRDEIFAELSGSEPTAGFVEMAVRELGASRILFGSDVHGRSFSSQIAKVTGAEVADSDKELILGGNLRRLLRPIMKAKGYRE